MAARPRDPRPAGSWGAAIDRARASWDALTGGPHYQSADSRRLEYSDAAAAAILATALGLWADTAASMGEDAPED